MKPRVLLADDEPDLMQLVGKRLEYEGFEVLMARDGEEALAKARAEQPDLIVLDLMMPKFSGFQACKALREDERFQRTPIIFFTGKYSRMDKPTLQAWGADAFLRKDEGGKALVELMNALLAKSKPSTS